MQSLVVGCYIHRDQSYHLSAVLTSVIYTSSQRCEEPALRGEELGALELEKMRIHHGQAYNLGIVLPPAGVA
jgi:hypothetical protein